MEIKKETQFDERDKKFWKKLKRLYLNFDWCPKTIEEADMTMLVINGARHYIIKNAAGKSEYYETNEYLDYWLPVGKTKEEAIKNTKRVHED